MTSNESDIVSVYVYVCVCLCMKPSAVGELSSVLVCNLVKITVSWSVVISFLKWGSDIGTGCLGRRGWTA